MRVPNRFRVRTGELASNENYGNNGAFIIPFEYKPRPLQSVIMLATVIASDGEGWEHVSASFADRTPTWDEMCHIKDLFWEDDVTVVQFHPAKKDYVNNHEYCLHLWKPSGKTIDLPPKTLVGV